jgi:hypothetical protein
MVSIRSTAACDRVGLSTSVHYRRPTAPSGAASLPVTTTPYFFVHVMKTAGTTFRQHTRRLFRERVYPVPGVDDMYLGYVDIATLLSVPDERKAEIVAFGGHYPYIVTELFGIPLVTLTLLRDPVERTISFLKQLKRLSEGHQDQSLDEIYEDPFFFPTLVHNHQTKVFSMRVGDKLETIYDLVDIDAERLALAKENLAKTQVVGLSEQFDHFLAHMECRYEWEFKPINRMRASTEPWVASQALRRRIADENSADMELYEFARDLCRSNVYVRDA